MEKLEIIGVIFFILGTALFFSGFHNIDLSQNIMRLECEHNTTYTDETIGNHVLSMEQAYISGVRLMYVSFFLFFISLILLIVGDWND